MEAPIGPPAKAGGNIYINVEYALGSTFAMVNGEAEAARLMMGCRRNGKMTLFVLCNLIGETQLLSQTGIEFLDQFAKVSTSLLGIMKRFIWQWKIWKPSNIRIFRRKELEYLILLNRSMLATASGNAT